MRKLASLLVPVAVLAAMALPTVSSAQTATVTISGNTPGWLSQAQNLGAANPSQTIGITVWLRLQHENQLDDAARAVVTKGSANYHKFLSASQVQATYAPTNGTVNGVTHWLQAKGLTIADTAPNNVYIDAQGTIGQIEQAFHVSINNYSYQGQTYFSNSSDPSVDNSNGVNGQIAAVDGLDNANGYQPTIVRPTDGDANSTPSSYYPVCGDQNTSKTISTNTGSVTLTGFTPCGYSAHQLEKAYGVDKVCTATASGVSGLCGQGQTIVITDAYGSSTLQQDVNKYDQVNGLPALTVGQNLTIVNQPGITANKPANPHWGDPHGWQAEVTLDVENAHAIAPGANIVLITTPNNGAPLDEGLNWAVVHHYGNIVSNSWGTFEAFMTPAHLNRDERILETGALEGIGFDFSSGDYGDNSPVLGVKTASYPASSDWVTAIGGTSLFLNSADNSYLAETGWGTTRAQDYKCSTHTTDSTGTWTCTSYVAAPTAASFIAGAGGGTSVFFAAPAWQSAAGVSSTHRVFPDVSMDADPYTGSAIYLTDLTAGDTHPVEETYGGTSLASPLFTAIMALVNQERAAEGKSPAGLAAQYLYNQGVFGTTALHDVSGTVPSFAQNGLFFGRPSTGGIYTIFFNQDTSLAARTGWDNVTGVGTPNGQSFIMAVAGQ